MGNTVAFVVLYIYVQFLLCPFHTLIAILTGKGSAYHMTKNICDIMNVKFLHTKGSKNLHKEAMYLCNHRSWGDFYMDQVICGGGAFLSRLLVILGCPGSALAAWVCHSTWFFNRKKGLDRDGLAHYLQSYWLKRPGKGLIVYPEGTRNQGKDPLRLKTGALYMAYKYNRPVQSVITTNKEKVTNEKKLHVERNVSCVTSISDVIIPSKFATFETFVQAVRDQYQETWDDAYATTNLADTQVFVPPLGLPTPTYDDLPIPQRVWIMRVIVALCGTAYYLSRSSTKT